jgi:hypothetical protein
VRLSVAPLQLYANQNAKQPIKQGLFRVFSSKKG